MSYFYSYFHIYALIYVLVMTWLVGIAVAIIGERSKKILLYKLLKLSFLGGFFGMLIGMLVGGIIASVAFPNERPSDSNAMLFIIELFSILGCFLGASILPRVVKEDWIRV